MSGPLILCVFWVAGFWPTIGLSLWIFSKVPGLEKLLDIPPLMLVMFIILGIIWIIGMCSSYGDYQSSVRQSPKQ